MTKEDWLLLDALLTLSLPILIGVIVMVFLVATIYRKEY